MRLIMDMDILGMDMPDIMDTLDTMDTPDIMGILDIDTDIMDIPDLDMPDIMDIGLTHTIIGLRFIPIDIFTGQVSIAVGIAELGDGVTESNRKHEELK